MVVAKKKISKEEPRKPRDYKRNTQGESAHTMNGQHDKELRKTRNFNKHKLVTQSGDTWGTQMNRIELMRQRNEYEAPKTQDYQNKTGTKLCTE